jgi:hypothetical protein
MFPFEADNTKQRSLMERTNKAKEKYYDKSTQAQMNRVHHCSIQDWLRQ